MENDRGHRTIKKGIGHAILALNYAYSVNLPKMIREKEKKNSWLSKSDESDSSYVLSTVVVLVENPSSKRSGTFIWLFKKIEFARQYPNTEIVRHGEL